MNVKFSNFLAGTAKDETFAWVLFLLQCIFVIILTIPKIKLLQSAVLSIWGYEFIHEKGDYPKIKPS